MCCGLALLEPKVDPDPGPAAEKPLAGDVVNGGAELSVVHPAARVWFLEVTNAGPVAGLDLPTLPDG